ncbi:MAG: cytochrome c [Pseudomonadales bacterium]|nr:cytochrome c [Pseudomonadales bacterium]MCP5330533.1 cytochrome c [Pseudomonadales bacterium]MCP5344861.1 cytochrome c [Pseudomonadales bacterium]
MTINKRILIHGGLILLGSGVLAACSPQASSPTDTMAQADRYDLQLDMKAYMNMVLDPVADILWDHAGWVDDVNTGYEELYPRNDEEWLMVQQGAAQLIEAGNALALPGRAQDDDGWVTYANALSQAASLAYRAAAEQNQEDFFQAGAQVYSVCSACHQTYNPEVSRFVNSN